MTIKVDLKEVPPPLTEERIEEIARMLSLENEDIKSNLEYYTYYDAFGLTKEQIEYWVEMVMDDITEMAEETLERYNLNLNDYREYLQKIKEEKE